MMYAQMDTTAVLPHGLVNSAIKPVLNALGLQEVNELNAMQHLRIL
jgi:hypothetical protein